VSRKSGRNRERRPARPIPGWVTVAVVGGAFAAIAWWERKHPLRERRELQAIRTGRNLTMAGLSATAVTLTESLVAARVEAKLPRGEGLIPRLRLPRAVEIVLGVLLLDYSLWWWHRFNHEAPFLWRFHLVHHVDLDLDASTALRFHFGEMSMSVLYRLVQTRLSGADPFTTSLWQLMLLVSILFHHSNICLPDELDRRLARLIVTPRMHGIHHSHYRNETDSNWSSLFTIWDLVHGTMRLEPPQKEIRIGVPAYQSVEDVRLPRLIELPFREQREDWRDAGGTLRIER
jgi:sterol desaturase/sphingolipid hydroxylase (fatty acid hydroxylase superfamily)